MSETQALLSKIAALRQRLEQAQGLAHEAGSAAAFLARGPVGDFGRLGRLEHQVRLGSEDNALLDTSIRQITEPSGAVRVLPAQLTARARRLLERGRALLGRLRDLGKEYDLVRGAEHDPSGLTRMDTVPGDLIVLYREATAMTDVALRVIQAFPDAPGAQLRLCDGLEAILELIAQRLDLLGGALKQYRQVADRIQLLTGLLTDLEAERATDIQPFIGLAEAILGDVQEGAPLRLLEASIQQPARFIACHSLTVAQVIARVVRHDPDMRGRPLEPVLAALIHDAGMLRVAPAVLAHAGPLDDAQRRAVESHCLIGAELAARLLPTGSWLAEAAATHHERLDGSGYPAGLRDAKILPLPRLLAVCDVYAALCASRPQRPAREPRTALTDTLLLAEQGLLDRNHAEHLLHLSFYPVGAAVELADGAVGVVLAIHHDRDLATPSRPVLAVLTDAQAQPLPRPRFVDLADCEGQSIVRTLPLTERHALLGKRYPDWI